MVSIEIMLTCLIMILNDLRKRISVTIILIDVKGINFYEEEIDYFFKDA